MSGDLGLNPDERYANYSTSSLSLLFKFYIELISYVYALQRYCFQRRRINCWGGMSNEAHKVVKHGVDVYFTSAFISIHVLFLNCAPFLSFKISYSNNILGSIYISQVLIPLTTLFSKIFHFFCLDDETFRLSIFGIHRWDQ